MEEPAGCWKQCSSGQLLPCSWMIHYYKRDGLQGHARGTDGGCSRPCSGGRERGLGGRSWAPWGSCGYNTMTNKTERKTHKSYCFRRRLQVFALLLKIANVGHSRADTAPTSRVPWFNCASSRRASSSYLMSPNLSVYNYRVRTRSHLSKDVELLRLPRHEQWLLQQSKNIMNKYKIVTKYIE